jgi:hypothetical protein
MKTYRVHLVSSQENDIYRNYKVVSSFARNKKQINKDHVRLEVFTAVTMKNAVF